MNKRISLNMNQLKLIAMIFMLIDHMAYIFIELGVGLYGNWYTIDRIMRGMGRVAFPIFCFTIVEGFQRTKDAKKYLLRLMTFAMISEIPFDLAFRGVTVASNYCNVFWTLAFGLALLILYEDRLLTPIFRIFGIAACVFVPYIIHTDYSLYGVLTIFALYYFRKSPILACLAGYTVLLMQSTTEVWAVFGFLLILLYNGERGKGNKLFYYAFYPVHLLLLVFIKPWVVAWLGSFMVGFTVIASVL